MYTSQPRLLAAFIGCLKLPFLGLTLEDDPASYWVKVNSFSWASCFVSTSAGGGGNMEPEVMEVDGSDDFPFSNWVLDIPSLKLRAKASWK